jgi:energy-coupling factor transporter transmembrane protein EcfT
LPWLVLHPWDVALFAGVPTVAIALYSGFHARSGPPRQFALALGLTLGLLVVLGVARGETGRVWMFLMPLIVVVAAFYLATLSVRRLWLLAGCQVFWLLVMNLVMVTVWTVDVAPPPKYQQVAPPPLATSLIPVDATFGEDEMKLAGYQAQYRPESHSLALAFHWQPLKTMATPYYFSGVLVAPDGTVLPGENWQPLEERFRTTCWSPQQQVVDQMVLTLPENPLPGNWWLSFSAFSYQEGQEPEPLPIHLPDGNTDRQVGLGPIEVTSP